MSSSLSGKHWHLYLAFALLAIMPCVNVWVTDNPSLQWGMPAWLQIHYLAIYWGSICAVLGYVFGYCCGAKWLTAARTTWLLIVFAVLSLSTVQFLAWWKNRMIPQKLVAMARVSSDGVILQTGNATCVAASAANIARILGVSTSEAEMCVLLHTTVEGTTPAQALAGLEGLGISGRKVTVPDKDIHTVRPPAILFLQNDTHAVVYAGMSKGRIEIWNPTVGKIRLTERGLRGLWTGHALEFWRED
jgi:hypothetical protein